MNPIRFTSTVALLLLTAAVGAQNNNDMPLNSGGEVCLVLSDPSSGSASGTVPPPVFTGDYFWKIYPREALHCKDGSIRAEVMWESMVDTDWSTPPDFWDRAIGNAFDCGGTDLDLDHLPDCLPTCARVPDWFVTGGYGTGQVLYILGSGVPNPCAISPPLCTSGGLCPLSGFLGYEVQWFGFAQPIACDGSETSYLPSTTSGVATTPGYDGDVALTYFAPGGMVFSNPATPGSCGFGDYVFQMEYSTNETQGDCCGQGFSPYSGMATAASGTWGSFLDPLSFAPRPHLGFDEDLVNALADSGGGLGLETSIAAGGALNGLCLDTSSGTARLAIELRDFSALTTPSNLGVVAFSARGPIPAPGVPVLGAALMIAPDPVFRASLRAGPVTAAGGIGFGFPGEALFLGESVAVPALGLAPGSPRSLYAQGFVLDLSALPALTAEETQVWEVRVL